MYTCAEFLYWCSDLIGLESFMILKLTFFLYIIYYARWIVIFIPFLVNRILYLYMSRVGLKSVDFLLVIFIVRIIFWIFFSKITRLDPRRLKKKSYITCVDSAIFVSQTEAAGINHQNFCMDRLYIIQNSFHVWAFWRYLSLSIQKARLEYEKFIEQLHWKLFYILLNQTYSKLRE